MKKILIFSPVLALLFAACAGSGSSKDVLADTSSALPGLNVSPTTQTITPELPANTTPQPNPTTGLQTNPAVKSVTAPTVNTVTPANGLNPAHGQPGHRCEIPVGSPLNSKPAATTTQPTTQPLTVTPQVNNPIVVNQPTPATNNPVTTAPGMNPAHGQPGHRCDIAVGSPLNSKPAPTSNVNVSPVKIVEPVKQDNPKQ